MKEAFLTGGSNEAPQEPSRVPNGLTLADLSERANKAPKTPKKAPLPGTAGGLSKFQKFEAITIHRRDIKNAPYNPRFIGEAERKRLRGNLKKVGLLATLTWNENTGNLVSGHQRIKELDDLEGTDDYTLTVARVRLDLKTEKEQNIFMNSPNAQGRFNFDLMGALLPDIDPGSAGLDQFDLAQMGAVIEANNLQVDAYTPPPTPGIDTVRADAERAAAKEEMQAKRQAAGQVLDQQNTPLGESHLILSFSTAQAKAAFLASYGYPGEMRMVKGEDIVQRIGVALL